MNEVKRSWRAFSGHVERTASEWRSQAVTALEWTPTSRAGVAGGEARGFFATAEAPEALDGFAKPGKNDPPPSTLPRAAHEKAASDLAFDLGLPVPPVVLWERSDPQSGEERYAAISLLPFTPVYQLADLARLGADSALLRVLAAAASAMAVFDTWLENTDHGPLHGGNLVASGSVTEFAYIDYAYSMLAPWSRHGHTSVTALPLYPAGAALDIDSMRWMIERIEAMPSQQIEAIVDRIPAGFLNAQQATALKAGLLERRNRLAPAMAATYPGVRP